MHCTGKVLVCAAVPAKQAKAVAGRQAGLSNRNLQSINHGISNIAQSIPTMPFNIIMAWAETTRGVAVHCFKPPMHPFNPTKRPETCGQCTALACFALPYPTHLYLHAPHVIPSLALT